MEKDYKSGTKNLATASLRSRRKLLRSAGTVGLVALAGCTGGNGGDDGDSDDSSQAGSDDEPETVTISMTGAGSFSLGTAQALQSVVRQHSDTVDLNVSEVSGNPESIQEFGVGAIDSYSTENFSLMSAVAGDPPFSEEMEVAPQGFVNLVFHYYVMAVEGSGLETTDDLVESDASFWPFPPAWGSRLVQEKVLEAAGLWGDLEDQVVNLEAGDVPGAIQEGRVDAFMAQGATYEGLAGWGTEIDSSSDVYVLETTDSWLDGIAQVDGIEAEEIEPYGWQQDVGTDRVTAWNNGVQFSFSPNVDDEIVYEIARVSHEHPDELRAAMGQYMDHSNVEDMVTNLLSDVPVHPGAAAFFQDHDAWDDDLTIA